MKQLTALRDAVCAGNPLIGIRGLAVLAFLAALGAMLARSFHQLTLADFLGGLAVGFTAGLMLITFGLESARTKDEPSENKLTELGLSR